MFLKIKPIELIKDKDIKFGTSGLRGLVSDFSDIITTSYTIAFLTYLKNKGFKFKRVVVGSDLRFSSPRLVNSVLHGIRQCDLIPIYTGTILTPALVYYGLQHNLPTIMVTGSHIPDNRNGLKFTTPIGEITKLDEKSISEIDLQVDISGFNKNGSLKVKEYSRKDNKVLSFYKQRYIKVIPENLFLGLKLGLYEHSSVARDFYKEFYQSLGAEVISFGRSNSFIPVDTEAIRKEDMAIVKGWCADNKVHCVFSSDGDADRPLVFDSNGEVIRGDLLGILVSKVLKADIVVTPVSSNTAIEKCNWFETVIRTKIGSPYVLESMGNKRHEDKIVVGFEANGGFIHNTKIKLLNGILEPLPTRDSTLVHLCILIGLLGNKIGSSKVRALLPSRHICSDLITNINPDKVSKILSRYSKFTAGQDLLFNYFSISNINTLDGVRFFLDNGDIIHLRLSGNAPEIRCYCESDAITTAELLCQRVIISLKELDIF